MDGNKLQDAAIEVLLENNEFYQSIATPIKSAAVCKAEHLAFLREAVKMEKFKFEFNNAVDLLILEMLGFVGERRWKEMLVEFSQCITDTTVYSFSEKTLDQIYQLGKAFIERSRFNEAYSIFLFLAYLSPETPEYWLGMGIALYFLQRCEEAILYLTPAAVLQQQKAAAPIYIIYCQAELKNDEAAKNLISTVEDILANSEEENAKWGSEFAILKQKLIKGG